MYLIHIIIYHDINIGQKELHNVMQLYRSLCIFYETCEKFYLQESFLSLIVNWMYYSLDHNNNTTHLKEMIVLVYNVLCSVNRKAANILSKYEY